MFGLNECGQNEIDRGHGLSFTWKYFLIVSTDSWEESDAYCNPQKETDKHVSLNSSFI